MSNMGIARALALGVPVVLLAGALGSQYIGGLYPCEMCHWQRWPHYAAVPVALLAVVLGSGTLGRVMLWLAALLILSSGAIGVFHAGVEYDWWEGVTSCANLASTGDFMQDVMATPVIACDRPQWTLGGISLAGFNAIFSILAAMVILWLTIRKAR